MKHTDLFCGVEIVHAAFDVKQYRGGVGVDIVILEYGPVCLIEAVLLLLRRSLWPDLYNSGSSGSTCADVWSVCWGREHGDVVRLPQVG